MSEPQFFHSAKSLTIAEIVALSGAQTGEGASLGHAISNIAPLDTATPHDLTFLENPKYVDQLASTRAGACLVSPRFAERTPQHVVSLRVREPYRAFVAVARALFPDALRPSSLFAIDATTPGAQEQARRLGHVHPRARLESDVVVDPGAVIGPDAEVGAGTLIGANVVVGPGVRIGRQCSIGAASSITNALIGDRVIVHPGCRIGQDGFGYVMGRTGHTKVPQLGRVIIQDDVEIGAGTTIDRGANRDTVVGEGTKVDNLVQIGHNVCIGRHCVIVAQAGISGSVTLEDFVVLGARAGVNNHVTIGEGAQIAGTGIVHGDVPPGARWGGFPAKPVKLWLREVFLTERMARQSLADTSGGAVDQEGRRPGNE